MTPNPFDDYFKSKSNFTTNTGFTSQTSGFGQPQQTSGFGQPQQTSGFGQPQQTSGFGQPQQTSGFGQSNNLFNQTQPQQFTTSFGQQPSSQTQQTTASFGQLGSSQTTNPFASQQTFNSTGNQTQLNTTQTTERVNPFGPQPIFRSKASTPNGFGDQTVNLFSQSNSFQPTTDQQQNFQNNNLINKITKKDSNPDDVSILLNNLYHSYVPGSSHYKFNYIFYNIVDKPFNKPMGISDEIWKTLYINDKLMPVKLNKIQINERRKAQSELAIKIAESKYNMQLAIEKLRLKREIAKSHFKNVLDKYREYAQNFVNINENDILNLRSSILNTNSGLILYPSSSSIPSTTLHNINRDKFYVKDKDNCLEVVKEIKKKLISLDKKIDDDLKKCEQRKFSLHNLLDNRI